MGSRKPQKERTRPDMVETVAVSGIRVNRRIGEGPETLGWAKGGIKGHVLRSPQLGSKPKAPIFRHVERKAEFQPYSSRIQTRLPEPPA